jgi:hypothetical protein
MERLKRLLQTIESTAPPSTRKAAPVVADACGEATYTTMLTTSMTLAAR